MTQAEIIKKLDIKNKLKNISYIPLKYTLMGAFLSLILILLLASSIGDYINTRYTLTHFYQDFQQQTENNINTVIKVVDTSQQVLIDSMMQKVQTYLNLLYTSYPSATDTPSTLMPHSSQHQVIVQIFDLAGHVVFNSEPTITATPSNMVLSGKEIAFGQLEIGVGHRPVISYSAERLSADQQYRLRVILQSQEFSALMGELDLYSITQRLRNLNTMLDYVRIFSPTGQLLNQSNFKADANLLHILQQVAQTRATYTVEQPERQRIIKYSYLGLTNAQNSKIIEWTYNTRSLQDGLKRTIGFNLLIAIISIGLSIVLTLFIAAQITKPLKHLVESVNIIASGNLQHEIQGKVHNELKVLKSSIVIMVHNMLNYIEDIKQKHQQNIELKQLDKLKDEFLSNTSHELRTPIHGIIGIVESLLDGAAGQLTENMHNNLSMVVISGRRLINLVNDILDFSRLKHNDIDLNIQPVEVRVITDIVLTLSRPLVNNPEIRLINHLKPGETVLADENRLQQILHNLIGNALKFTETGKIEVYGHRNGNMLDICVRDTGIGIPPEQLERIFNAFEQGDGSVTRIYGGTGLGLSITRQLVELHNGKMRIESKVKQGSTVFFSLPLSQETVTHASTVQEVLTRVRNNMTGQRLVLDTQKYQDTIPKLDISLPEISVVTDDAMTEKTEKLRILVVDDDPINRQVLENQLILENYAVSSAIDGFMALQFLEEATQPYALMLLDVMMPKISGLEVCKIVREQWSPNELPIIMLTARNQVSDLVAGLQCGANDYLTKPFSRNELSSRIKTHIHLSQVSIAYSHFVPLEFLHLLEKDSILDVKLGNHVQKDMTILFADIRSFTSLSESMTPEENFIFLNGYLRYVSPVIRRHHGFIDKYIGDAMMALFPETVDHALQAAIEMHQELAIFNRQRLQQNLKPIRIGIGLHTGLLTLGTIGEEKRMESTVISDAVNLASRIEGLTKLYGSSIIVSEQVLNQLKDLQRYEYRFLGKLRVKGKQQPVKVFEIIDSDLEDVRTVKIRLKHLFDSALNSYYERNFVQAAGKFFHILTQHKEDRAASFYIRRCEYYMKHGVPEDWDGVENIEEK